VRRAAPKAFFGDRLVCTKIARIFTVNGSCGSRTLVFVPPELRALRDLHV
jgi:hypothetical protein